MRIYMQNQSGYKNSSSKISTSGNTIKKVSAKESLKNGAKNSSKSEINIARFDTVPMIRFVELIWTKNKGK